MYEKAHYITVGILTILVFALGIFIGNAIADAKIDYAKQLNTQLTLESRGIQLKYEIAGTNICKVFDTGTLFDELYNIGAKLDYLENTKKEGDMEIAQLKEYYQILEIENWLLIKEYRERCGARADIVLYFYSNKGDCPSCDQQGHALTYLRRNNDGMYIFSFDINSANPAIDMLKTTYGVERTPTVIIGDTPYVGLQTAEQIRGYLDAQ